MKGTDVYCHSTWKVRVGGGRECSFLITRFLCSVHTFMISATLLTWGQKPMYIRRNLPMVERVFKILKLIVISPHDSIKCQSWEGFEKIAFYHYKKAHFYTVGQNHPWVGANKPDLFGAITLKRIIQMT